MVPRVKVSSVNVDMLHLHNDRKTMTDFIAL